MRTKVMDTDITRYSPSLEVGLSNEEVNKRKEQGLVNKTILVVGKSYWEILRTDVLSFFNILLFTIAGLMIYANVADANPHTKWYNGIFFVGVLIANIIIGLYQDLKAKHLMKKMKLVSTKEVKVLRNKELISINPEEIVLDDIISFSAGEQIVSDSIIKEGTVTVNESLLTGESDNIVKTVGELIYSGTYIVSGKCLAQVDKVGKENYVETLAVKAKAFKRNPSHILKSLKRLFRVLGGIIIFFSLVIVITYACLGKFSTREGFISIIAPIGGQLVAMIPAGLSLLTSVALASGVVSLFRKRANVQDLYSIEMLARTDVLCTDKTGTITDGTMNVKEVITLGEMSTEEISQIMSKICEENPDSNVTSLALKEYFNLPTKKLEIEKFLAFTSENKYSAATFKTGVTYVFGAYEFMNLSNKKETIKAAEDYLKKGYRVLTIAKGTGNIKKNKYEGELKANGLIIIQDHIKEDAKTTFEWFKNNHVEIKVISGDNAITVSEIAKEAGVENAERYISLEGMSLEEVAEVADKYTVFGRVTPEQKEALVIALKKAKKTVAMTGDGVNDILALKRADCSIAMDSGSQAAKNVSHIVLMDNNFSTMPSIVAEGRRVINNLQRTGSLFLTKTVFAIVVSAIFWIVSLFNRHITYPFTTNNLIVWETLGIGMSAFFVALEPNSAPIDKGFLSHILKRAIPGAIAIIFATLMCFILYMIQSNGLGYTGVGDLGFDILHNKAGRFGATGMAVMVYSFLSFVILYMTCAPLTKYRLAVVAGAPSIAIIAYLIAIFTSPEKNILDLNFNKINSENLFAAAIIVISVGVIAIFVNAFIPILKGLKKNDQNQ